MDRDCDICVYRTRHGCKKWECDGTTTLDDYTKQVKTEAFDEYKDRLLTEFCSYCNQDACEGGMVGTIQECDSIRLLRDVSEDLAEQLKEKNK